MSFVQTATSAAERGTRKMVRRVGLNGACGLALALVAAVGWMLAHRLQLEAAHLQEQAAAARATVAARPGGAARTELAPRDRAALLEGVLPDTGSSTADLRRLFQIARDSRVQLAEGQYNLVRLEGTGDLMRLDVSLPVREHYPAVKRFVSNVLNAMPHASLTELHAERPDSAAEDVDATVHFALYYRGAGARP